MKKHMQIIPILLFISGFLVGQQALAQSTDPVEMTMCTMDVRQCPDGSFVGRTGPMCEFVCPTLSTSTEPAVSTDPAPNEVSSSAPGQQPSIRGGEAVREAIREERRAALSEIRQQRIVNLAANISNRMDAAVDRLFAIIARIETRMQKLRLAGIDTSQAALSLQEASRTLAEARALLSDIDTAVSDATSSDNAYEEWQNLRERYQTIAGLIRGSHTSLRQAISQLKQAPTQAERSLLDASTSTDALRATTSLPTL